MSETIDFREPVGRPAHLLALRVSAKRLPGVIVHFARSVFERLLGFTQFNAIYHQLPCCDAAEFPQAYLDAISVKVEWDGQPADSIPATEALIVVSNHPYGLIEAMAIDSLILSRRGDTTAMASWLFQAIPEIRDRSISVGSRGSRRHRERSVRGWRETFQWLKKGGSLLIFPGSRVSRFHWRSLSIKDESWSAHVGGLARRTGAPVLPFYIYGRNSWLFQLAGALSPTLQDFLVIREATNKRGWKLRGTIGKIIPPESIAACSSDEEAIALLRRETEKLA
ncbi:MAG: hypothetical protein ABL994_11375 [Verrucomicrobiales bacterium]